VEAPNPFRKTDMAAGVVQQLNSQTLLKRPRRVKMYIVYEIWRTLNPYEIDHMNFEHNRLNHIIILQTLILNLITIYRYFENLESPLEHLGCLSHGITE
jgi:hypothetical protein